MILSFLSWVRQFQCDLTQNRSLKYRSRKHVRSCKFQILLPIHHWINLLITSLCEKVDNVFVWSVSKLRFIIWNAVTVGERACCVILVCYFTPIDVSTPTEKGKKVIGIKYILVDRDVAEMPEPKTIKHALQFGAFTWTTNESLPKAFDGFCNVRFP